MEGASSLHAPRVEGSGRPLCDMDTGGGKEPPRGQGEGAVGADDPWQTRGAQAGGHGPLPGVGAAPGGLLSMFASGDSAAIAAAAAAAAAQADAARAAEVAARVEAARAAEVARGEEAGSLRELIAQPARLLQLLCAAPANALQIQEAAQRHGMLGALEAAVREEMARAAASMPGASGGAAEPAHAGGAAEGAGGGAGGAAVSGADERGALQPRLGVTGWGEPMPDVAAAGTGGGGHGGGVLLSPPRAARGGGVAMDPERRAAVDAMMAAGVTERAALAALAQKETALVAERAAAARAAAAEAAAAEAREAQEEAVSQLKKLGLTDAAARDVVASARAESAEELGMAGTSGVTRGRGTPGRSGPAAKGPRLERTGGEGEEEERRTNPAGAAAAPAESSGAPAGGMVRSRPPWLRGGVPAAVVPESHPSWSLGANRGLVREEVPEERTVALAVIRGAMWFRDDEPEDWPRYPAMGDPPPVAPGMGFFWGAGLGANTGVPGLMPFQARDFPGVAYTSRTIAQEVFGAFAVPTVQRVPVFTRGRSWAGTVESGKGRSGSPLTFPQACAAFVTATERAGVHSLHAQGGVPTPEEWAWARAMAAAAVGWQGPGGAVMDSSGAPLGPDMTTEAWTRGCRWVTSAQLLALAGVPPDRTALLLEVEEEECRAGAAEAGAGGSRTGGYLNSLLAAPPAGMARRPEVAGRGGPGDGRGGEARGGPGGKGNTWVHEDVLHPFLDEVKRQMQADRVAPRDVEAARALCEKTRAFPRNCGDEEVEAMEEIFQEIQAESLSYGMEQLIPHSLLAVMTHSKTGWAANANGGRGGFYPPAEPYNVGQIHGLVKGLRKKTDQIVVPGTLWGGDEPVPGGRGAMSRREVRGTLRGDAGGGRREGLRSGDGPADDAGPGGWRDAGPPARRRESAEPAGRAPREAARGGREGGRSAAAEVAREQREEEERLDAWRTMTSERDAAREELEEQRRRAQEMTAERDALRSAAAWQAADGVAERSKPVLDLAEVSDPAGALARLGRVGPLAPGGGAFEGLRLALGPEVTATAELLPPAQHAVPLGQAGPHAPAPPGFQHELSGLAALVNQWRGAPAPPVGGGVAAASAQHAPALPREAERGVRPAWPSGSTPGAGTPPSGAGAAVRPGAAAAIDAAGLTDEEEEDVGQRPAVATPAPAAAEAQSLLRGAQAEASAQTLARSKSAEKRAATLAAKAAASTPGGVAAGEGAPPPPPAADREAGAGGTQQAGDGAAAASDGAGGLGAASAQRAAEGESGQSPPPGGGAPAEAVDTPGEREEPAGAGATTAEAGAGVKGSGGGRAKGRGNKKK